MKTAVVTGAVLACQLLSFQVGASPIVVDVDGRIAGFYVGTSTENRTEYAASQKGYRFGFDRESGRLMRPEGTYTDANGQVFYTTTDCTGQAYITVHDGIKLGVVFPAAYASTPSQATGVPLLYYLAQVGRPSTQTVMRRSFWAFLGAGTQILSCFNALTPDARDAIPLIPNDPAETGVPNGGFVPPLRVISSWLFRDGFELSAKVPFSARLASA